MVVVVRQRPEQQEQSDRGSTQTGTEPTGSGPKDSSTMLSKFGVVTEGD